MKDETEGGGSEVDVVKFYIWLMLAMTAVLAGFLVMFWNQVETVRRSVQQGTTWKKDFEKLEGEIQGMVNVYRTNKEDTAREAPETWFPGVWRRRGIDNASMGLGAWKNPPTYNARGKYLEEQMEMTFNSKSPLPRQSIAEFCHEVEKSSTRLRVIELDVRRTDRENYEKDEWSGKAMIGYRHPRQE